MKRKLIEIEHTSLIQCDNKPCDFTVPVPPDGNMDTSKWLNVPCPKCGDNLLTEEDHYRYKSFMAKINWINRWFSWLTVFSKKKPEVFAEVGFHKELKIEKKS